MNRIFYSLGLPLAMAGLLFLSLAGAKCKDDCEKVICKPCPNSRLLVKYVDNLGNCDLAFNSSAMIYGLSSKNLLDTLFSYTLSDSCTAAYLIQEDVVYHLVASNFRDTLVLTDWKYQAGVPVTECCLCYPVEYADVLFGSDSSRVEWPDTLYENLPVVRVIN